MNDDEYLPVAFRAWTGQRNKRSGKKTSNYPLRRLLVIDTETTTDTRQSLMFGAARLVRITWRKKPDGTYQYVAHRTENEVLFHADNLAAVNPSGYSALTAYARQHHTELIPRAEFMQTWVRRYCMTRVDRKGNTLGDATMVFFNAPFDLSRMAESYGLARDTLSNDGGIRTQRKGGFSFRMFPELQPCKPDCKRDHKHVTSVRENPYAPRLTIKHIDSKKALISWGTRKNGDAQATGLGHFLDIRQLIWGMTNVATSLARACEMFGLPDEYRKTHAETYGHITPEFIDYARQDVKATTELAVTVLAEYMRHPIDLQATKVFSAASIAKAYLRKMGVTPMLDRPGIPADPSVMGRCVSTFYGGRAEAHIRNTPVPVTVCDFTSMYPTVNVLMRLWDHVTAARIGIASGDVELSRFVALASDVATRGVTPVLDKAIWPMLTGFARVVPDGDILPVRAHYGSEAYNVGLNYFYCSEPVWYTMPDVLASALLTGKAPRIIDVMRFVPDDEKLDTLNPVKLGGTVAVNPAQDDFFKTVVEQRAAIKAQVKAGKSGTEGKRTTEALKVLANSGSYGIYVEMLRDDETSPAETTAYGIWDEPWNCRPNAVESAQEFCYPPIGAVITGAARLMLATVERLVTDAGGSWLFCDTDSMAIVTSHDGELIECDGGQHRTMDGKPAVKPLTRGQVETIRETVNALNPYDRSKIPELLKDETADTNVSGQVYGYAISAKRYALFTYDTNGRPIVPEKIDGKSAYMQHGLGLYLNPADTRNPDGRDWIRQAWQWIIDQAHGIESPYPGWADNPALSRITVSSPHIMRAFRQWNSGKNYDGSVKPFSFVLLVSEFKGLLSGSEDKTRRLLAPYSNDPAEWKAMQWHDLNRPGADGMPITSGIDSGKVRVKNHRIVLKQYRNHAEHKSIGDSGVLARRTIRPSTITHIGKESNRIDDMEHGMVTELSQVFTTYPRENRSIIAAAFGNLSLRGITKLVNDESEALRRYIADKHDIRIDAKDKRTRERAEQRLVDIVDALNYYQRFGTPVKVDHKLITRYLNGSAIRDANQVSAIVRTAAKHIARQVGITPEGIGYEHGLIMPDKALLQWRDMEDRKEPPRCRSLSATCPSPPE